jgi:hypothetical protein
LFHLGIVGKTYEDPMALTLSPDLTGSTGCASL